MGPTRENLVPDPQPVQYLDNQLCIPLDMTINAPAYQTAKTLEEVQNQKPIKSKNEESPNIFVKDVLCISTRGCFACCFLVKILHSSILTFVNKKD